LSKMGHKDLLVTHIYRRTIPNARGGAHEASAVRLSCVLGMLSSLEVQVFRPT
jgi:hypothetical protein